jgi:hypothetical protein
MRWIIRKKNNENNYSNGVGPNLAGKGYCENILAFVGITIAVSYPGTYSYFTLKISDP